MKILVVSDTHGDFDALRAAMRREAPDCVLHLGDGWREVARVRETAPRTPVYDVAGNCDVGSGRPVSMTLELDGLRIFFTHGHRYHVKASPLRVILAAREQRAGLVCFGHTHQPLCEQQQDLWVLNPGSCHGPGASYAVVLTQPVLRCEIHVLGGKTDDSGD